MGTGRKPARERREGRVLSWLAEGLARLRPCEAAMQQRTAAAPAPARHQALVMPPGRLMAAGGRRPARHSATARRRASAGAQLEELSQPSLRGAVGRRGAEARVTATRGGWRGTRGALGGAGGGRAGAQGPATRTPDLATERERRGAFVGRLQTRPLPRGGGVAAARPGREPCARCPASAPQAGRAAGGGCRPRRPQSLAGLGKG